MCEPGCDGGCLSAAVIDDRRFVTACQRLRSSESATIGRLRLRRHASFNSSAPLGSSIAIMIGRNPPDHPGAIGGRARLEAARHLSTAGMTLHTNSREAPRSRRSGQRILGKHSTRYIVDKAVVSHLQPGVLAYTLATYATIDQIPFVVFFFHSRTHLRHEETKGTLTAE